MLLLGEYGISMYLTSLALKPVLDSRNLVRTILGHSDWVRYVVPSDDGALLASCSNDKVCL